MLEKMWRNWNHHILLAIYPKEVNSGCQSDICIPIFIAALFTVAKIWNQPNGPSTDEWTFIQHFFQTFLYTFFIYFYTFFTYILFILYILIYFLYFFIYFYTLFLYFLFRLFYTMDYYSALKTRK